jgi:hypothetical protein
MNNSLLLPGLGFQQPRAWRLGTGRGFRKVLYPAAAAAAATGSAWGGGATLSLEGAAWPREGKSASGAAASEVLRTTLPLRRNS